MAQADKHWKVIGKSRFSWEQEALDFVYGQFPAQDNYRAWANFEFIGDDGSINEVDLLVVCPQGVFLIEIKSRPGTLTGDSFTWTWEHEGRKHTSDNPVLLANLKCKRLKSLLGRQRAFKKVSMPYIDPLVFCSVSDLKCHLQGSARYFICLRDVPETPGQPGQSGIMAAIQRRECPGLKQVLLPAVNRPTVRAFVLAMDQAGVRPSQSSRRVGDFVLDRLVYQSPTGAYQDWEAKHVSMGNTSRLARIYMVSTQAIELDRVIIRKAAHREFELLERLDHPGILRSDPPTECENGPILFFRRDPASVRLDHFLHDNSDSLPVDQRLGILRQVAEVIHYAHGKKILHRSLSPQSILVRPEGDQQPTVQVFNWQTGFRLPGTLVDEDGRVSASLHASQLVEDASMVFLAPEAVAGNADGGPEMDVFSLGALAYFLFTGKPPAASIMDLREKLRDSLTGSLNISDAMDGALESLKDLIKGSAIASVSDRGSVEDFLAGLDLVEEEMYRPDLELVNPLEATKGQVLHGDLQVVSRLGGGAVSVVFLVQQDGEERVLKVARKADYNSRLESEFKILKKLRSPHVVQPFQWCDFGALVGFTMERAGEENLAQRIRREGPLDLSMLHQFGDDLIRTVQFLDEQGIAHRDLKPENIGIRMRGKKRYKLCLFDFSLSDCSPDEINVGTVPYLDPFLAERRIKRWDVSSECFSAAVTLHEMATGLLPSWGDGRTPPQVIRDEVTIRPELFDPNLRDSFVSFFGKALRRDYRERFYNPEAMLHAWNDVFATLDVRKGVSDQKEPALELPPDTTPHTQLVLLGLSTRLNNALDRLNLLTVTDLLAYPLVRIYGLAGVGNKTRRELGELVKRLRERLPEADVVGPGTVKPASDENEETAAFASVDLIARQVATTTRRTEQEVLQLFLGWTPIEGKDPDHWPSQADLAPLIKVTRARVSQVLVAARQRWKRFPSVTSLRDAIHEILKAKGGVTAHSELIAAILTARGSTFEEPKRTRMALVAVRAALEAEQHLREPRFQDYRSSGHVIIAATPELKHYAVQLGKRADHLVLEDPLPTPARVLQELQTIAAPPFPSEVTPINDSRLPQLSVEAADAAALSSRMELYPIGLVPERALALAQNALFGGTLTVEEIRNRITARYPKAAPLPDRPELDELLKRIGLDLKWDQEAGAFVSPVRESSTMMTSDTQTARQATRFQTRLPVPDLPPDIADARALEDKLQYAAREGSFLVLSVNQRWLGAAQDELTNRFQVDVCDLDDLFLTTMQEQARNSGASWDVVLRADANGPGTTDWRNLQLLVDRCLPVIEQRLRSNGKTKLVLHPGLLARYDRMNMLGSLAADVGRTDGIHGVWVLLPANEREPLPTLNQKPVPITNAAQHVTLSDTWLSNKHRA